MNEYIIVLIVGFGLIALSLSIYFKKRKIKKSGIATEGIIYDLVQDQNASSNSSYPVVRFMTLNQEWITEKADTGMFPGFYKKGQDVKVIYQEENPKQFIIDSKTNDILLVFFFVSGILLIVFGAFKLLI